MKRIALIALLLLAGTAWAGEGYYIYPETLKGVPDPTAWKHGGKRTIPTGPAISWQSDETPAPHKTYLQLTRVPWDEVNEFLRTEAKEGRAWEHVDTIILTMQHWTGTHIWKEDDVLYVILKREVTE